MQTRLPVKDMPERLRLSAEWAGYDKTHEMTFEEAFNVWATSHCTFAGEVREMLEARDEFSRSLLEQT